MRVFVAFLSFLILPFFDCYCQDEIGINPPGLKWSKMETPAGPIIYPSGLDSTALNIAYRINSAYLFDTTEVLSENSNKTITSIIQNQSAFPEGFTITNPWRQELYLTPPQNMFMGPTIWKDGLTSHEYRHAQQFMAYNRGYSYLYKVAMGNVGWLLSTVLNVPLWYREGDAVDVETRFTVGGRGTLPAFHMEYRTLRLNGIKFNYEKAMSASNFKDFVPNVYRSGYYMSTRLRQDHGDDIGARVLNQSTGKFWYPFTRTLKQITGERTPQFYASTFEEMDSLWQASDTVTASIGNRISKRGKTFERYRFPQIDAQGNLIVSHTSLTNIRGFYQLGKDSSRIRVKTPGIYTSDHQNFVVEGNLLTWAEASFHPRYRNKNYSIVKMKDLRTGKTKQIGHRCKYFSPAPSKDGIKIAVIEYNEQERSSLKIIDINSGSVLHTFNYKNQFLTQPRWISDDEIILITVNMEGNQLMKLNTSKAEWTTLLNAYDINISKPFEQSGKVYFSSGFSGTENIFDLDPLTNEIRQLTNARFGAFDPFVKEDTLYFSNYDKNGYEIWKTPLSSALNKSVSFPGRSITKSLPRYYEERVKDRIDSLISIDSTYTSFFWNKFFYTGGWFPLVFPPELGVEFYTLNMERSFKSTIGINYNLNEDIVQTKFIGTYAKYFPLVNASFLRQGRRIEQAPIEYSEEDLLELKTRETMIGGGIEIPLNLTQGVYATDISIRGEFNHHIIDDLEEDFESFNFNSAVAGLTIARLRPRARRQINTSFGQIIHGHYAYGLSDQAPDQLFAHSQFYFPGLFNTHSLNFRCSYEDNNKAGPFRHLSLFRGSRGYEYYPFNEIYLLSSNYELPLFYPDVYAGGIVGLTRVRINAFMDYSLGSNSEFEQHQRSYGGELIFDLRLFRAFNMDLRFQFIQRQDNVGSQDPFVLNLAVNYFELLN